jgi:hypothetical protein
MMASILVPLKEPLLGHQIMMYFSEMRTTILPDQSRVQIHHINSNANWKVLVQKNNSIHNKILPIYFIHTSENISELMEQSKKILEACNVDYVTYGRTERSLLGCKLFVCEDYEQGLTLTERGINKAD